MQWTVPVDFKNTATPIENFESEAELENYLIQTLRQQGFEYCSNLDNPQALKTNLKKQIERLNNFQFSCEEDWERFFSHNLANLQKHVIEKTELLRNSFSQVEFIDDEHGYCILKLLDYQNLTNNHLQVINQYKTTGGNYNNRYDVTILVNGLPLVQIELKKRGVDLKEAFDQIKRYSDDSYWADDGLFEFLQIFVISNGTYTRYYSNTTRKQSVEVNNTIKEENVSSSSYEFTFAWNDQNNNLINDLRDFAHTFLQKETLLNVLIRYCVFDTTKKLLVMRPYQINAVEQIIQKIKTSKANNQLGTIDANGYIWHATGSGKTLTSFKTAILVKQELNFVNKVLFVVDRCDLNKQTTKEFNRFQENSVVDAKSYNDLASKLFDTSGETRIIITTIQKLNSFLKEYLKDQTIKKQMKELLNSHVVFVFDECHRTQFGDMNNRIKANFKKYNLFGFTGTPIFAENAKKLVLSTKLKNVKFADTQETPPTVTTEGVFGECLAKYTLKDAIRDQTVLQWKTEYYSTVEIKSEVKEDLITQIDEEKIWNNEKRLSLVVNNVFSTFDKLTLNKRFNAIFATSSTKAAKLYYAEFKKQNALLPVNQQLKIAVIFTQNTNKDNAYEIGDEEIENYKQMSLTDRNWLAEAVNDYNNLFHTNKSVHDEKELKEYYDDVASRLANKEKLSKEQKLDLVIVVNMLLTGFDAPKLNTLFLDKNLKQHGLIQAFSRTNRTLNSVKDHGNIVYYRKDLEKEINEALQLFCEGGSQIALLREFGDYYFGFNDEHNNHKYGYVEYIELFRNKYPRPTEIVLEIDKKDFATKFSAFLKLTNLLRTFPEFTKDKENFNNFNVQDYMSVYLSIHEEFRKREKNNKIDVSEDVKFDLNLVKSFSINLDFILNLIQQHLNEEKNQFNQLVVEVKQYFESNYLLRPRKELILSFLEKMQASRCENIKKEFVLHTQANMQSDLEDIIQKFNLKPEETKRYMNNCLENHSLKTTGRSISDLLQQSFDLFNFEESTDLNKEKEVTDALQRYFNVYNNIDDLMA